MNTLAAALLAIALLLSPMADRPSSTSSRHGLVAAAVRPDCC